MPSWGIVLWPLLLVPLVIAALGVGMLFAALNVKYRDVQHVLPFLVQIWLFVTPVIWPIGMVPQKWQWLLAINPLTGIIEAFRACVVPGYPLDGGILAISMASTALLFLIGGLYFRHTARGFADVI